MITGVSRPFQEEQWRPESPPALSPGRRPPGPRRPQWAVGDTKRLCFPRTGSLPPVRDDRTPYGRINTYSGARQRRKPQPRALAATKGLPCECAHSAASAPRCPAPATRRSSTSDSRNMLAAQSLQLSRAPQAPRVRPRSSLSADEDRARRRPRNSRHLPTRPQPPAGRGGAWAGRGENRTGGSRRGPGGSREGVAAGPDAPAGS